MPQKLLNDVAAVVIDEGFFKTAIHEPRSVSLDEFRRIPDVPDRPEDNAELARLRQELIGVGERQMATGTLDGLRREHLTRRNALRRPLRESLHPGVGLQAQRTDADLAENGTEARQKAAESRPSTKRLSVAGPPSGVASKPTSTTSRKRGDGPRATSPAASRSSCGGRRRTGRDATHPRAPKAS